MRNYEGHKLVLKAIEDLRVELARHEGNFNLDSAAVLMRLSNLYACLNVSDLKQIVRDMENIDINNTLVTLKRRKKAA